jgi:Fe-S-cluster containining protein
VTVRVRALSIHAGYRCGHSGACCSSGWPIPVEPAAEDGLRGALASGRLGLAGADAAFRAVAGLPHGARVVLGQDVAGRCVFLEPEGERRLCAVHRRLGEGALPAACRHFPRVATLTPLGVSVTLSHYCPTAASLLFAAGGLAIVESPPAFPSSWPWEGLDAGDALPPLLRPGVLMDWPSLERWERFTVRVLAEDGVAPESALDVLAAAAEAARGWTASDGAFGVAFDRALGKVETAFVEALRDGGPAFAEAFRSGREALDGAFRNGDEDARDPARRGSRAGGGSRAWRAWRLVADCVPHRDRLPPEPVADDAADGLRVAPAWPSLALPVRRWLAAKAFASWLVLQGEGLRTSVLGLRVALGVLRAEAVRGCAEAGRPLDADLLKEAIRRADLLLVHLADPEAVARRLSRCERARSFDGAATDV